MGITAITSVLLFDGHTTHPSSTVIFDSTTGKILSVTKSADSPDIPIGAEIIDGTGHTLLPGLIDAHVHVHKLHLPADAEHIEVLKAPLRCGVTTICDMHSDPETVHGFRGAIREEVEGVRMGKGKVSLCDLKSSLYGATIQGGWPKPIVLGHGPSEELRATVATWPSLTPDTAPSFIADHKANGVDYIKLMQENCCSLALPTNSIPVATLELQTAVVDAAHAEGLLVVAHATSRESTELVLKAGADGLTHTFIDQAPSDEMLGLYRANNAFVIPTLVVLSSLTGELQGDREEFARIARGKLGVVDEFTAGNMVELLGMKAEQCTIEHGFETVRWCRRNGVDVVAGTDSAGGLKGTGVGPSLWMELGLYVRECGMSVVEALRCATGVSSGRFGFGDRGMVERGRRADLVLVGGDVFEGGLEVLWGVNGDGNGGGIVGVWKEGLRAV